MCATCGCSGDLPTVAGHEHGHEHGHGHGHGRARTVDLELDILAKNDRLAARNREWLLGKDILALNLMSSPGSGKTTVLERTVRELAAPVCVVEGDQETPLDADRIRATGAPVVQVNTGTGCHLDAHMLEHALSSLAPEPGSVLFVENVGNLVCPALFDLGEAHRVVIMSVTEGQDKPRKYPHMFAAADVVLLNKVDLLAYLDFEVAAFVADLRTVNPAATVLEVSAKTGTGMPAWYRWLRAHR